MIQFQEMERLRCDKFLPKMLNYFFISNNLYRNLFYSHSTRNFEIPGKERPRNEHADPEFVIGRISEGVQEARLYCRMERSVASLAIDSSFPSTTPLVHDFLASSRFSKYLKALTPVERTRAIAGSIGCGGRVGQGREKAVIV